ncbi:MAG TPA: ATP-binding protein [Ignavibacteriaceae bacterium]|nr:ATP-binding protein [Ignavibacteriaceae bacterium]
MMQQQRIISRAIIKAEEKERNRLGAELHDNVNQLLVSARLYIALEKKNKQSDHLDKADEYVGMAIEEIRVLTQRLTTFIVTNEGLERCIEEIANSMLELKDIRLTTDISDEAIKMLSADQQQMFYRIIQEQTSNILKHAETKVALISLQLVNDEIQLIISDNGKGFNKTEQKLIGIGFSNICNRVDAYDGKMEITSAPGKGCKLFICIPLNEENV